MCRKDSEYDSRKIQYNCVKNSTKSNLFNLHHTIFTRLVYNVIFDLIYY